MFKYIEMIGIIFGVWVFMLDMVMVEFVNVFVVLGMVIFVLFLKLICEVVLFDGEIVVVRLS